MKFKLNFKVYNTIVFRNIYYKQYYLTTDNSRDAKHWKNIIIDRNVNNIVGKNRLQEYIKVQNYLRNESNISSRGIR